MRVTAVILLLLHTSLSFAQNGVETNLIDTFKQQTCPLMMCRELTKDLGASEEKLKSTEKRLHALESKLQELTSRLVDSEAQIEGLRAEHTGRPKVAFSAALGSGGFFGPFDTDVTLVYKDAFINIGNAYNKNTGIFTAPVKGVYYFSFFYHCSTSHGTELALHKNGEWVTVTAHHKKKGPAENGGNGITLQLQKGDQLYINLIKNKWIWDGSNVTVFNGFLLYDM
ncbi:cerebellin 8 precursor [Danio rerio]|uniref:Cerebellin 8 n=1 Tax=Danio rerio TaxID=7955 RepID=A8KB43_DANRE|nr:cerebellin 8 precursor [Danio rerio]AAI53957.1 Zgc:171537 protein [Danio rerio]|eukprot:NP_001103579.1 uncharacterized protein LOC561171 precursor [Danio rerio]